MATATKKSVAKPVPAAKKSAAKPAPVVKKAAEKPVAAAKKAPAKTAPIVQKAVSKPAPAVKKAVTKAAPAVKKAAAKPAAAVKKEPAKALPASVAPVKATKQPAVRSPAASTSQTPKKPAKPASVTTSANTMSEPISTSKTQSKPAKKAPSKKDPAGLLTDAEILKMSDKDYMNEAQMAFFKHRLQTMKDEILVNARETGEHLKENEVFADPNDRATVEEENMLEQRVRDRERKLLKKIDSALARIESGDYGYCLESGEPIGVPRLLARPTAELSIEAQEKHERLERLFAD